MDGEGLNREEFAAALAEVAKTNAQMVQLYAPNGPIAKLLETGEIDTAAFARAGVRVTETTGEDKSNV